MIQFKILMSAVCILPSVCVCSQSAVYVLHSPLANLTRVEHRINVDKVLCNNVGLFESRLVSCSLLACSAGAFCGAHLVKMRLLRASSLPSLLL